MNVFEAIAHLMARVSDVYRRFDHSTIHGTVCDVDAKKQLCRVVVGLDDDGKEVKSAWIPYAQIAGTRKLHSPPSKGQTMTLYSPNGDIEQASAHPYHFSDNNPSPSEDPDADVEVRGKTRKTQKDADLKYEVDGLTHSWTKQAASVTVHKDKQKTKIGTDDDDKVDDKHPWKGNKEKALHSHSFNKKDGYTMTINVQEDGKKEGKEHKLKVHPDGGFTFSFGDEKHVVSISKDSIGISFDGGKHKIEMSPEGIKHTSSGRVTIDAPQIAHMGDLMLHGSLHAGGVIESVKGLTAPILSGAPGSPGSANKW